MSTAVPPGPPRPAQGPATAPGPPRAPGAGPESSARWGLGRVVAVVAGALTLIGALGLLLGAAVTGIGGAVLRDDQGYLMTPSASVASVGAAVVSQDLDVHGGVSSMKLPRALLGRAKIQVDPPVGGSMFVGLAHTDDVTSYLAGVAHSVLVDPGDPGNGRQPRYHYFAGAPQAQSPSSLHIWVASASGQGRQTITWPVQAGSWTLVVMNSDGVRPVTAQVAVGATVPALHWLAIGLLVAGCVVLAGAVVLLVLAFRTPRRKPADAVPPS